MRPAAHPPPAVYLRPAPAAPAVATSGRTAAKPTDRPSPTRGRPAPGSTPPCSGAVGTHGSESGRPPNANLWCTPPRFHYPLAVPLWLPAVAQQADRPPPTRGAPPPGFARPCSGSVAPHGGSGGRPPTDHTRCKIPGLHPPPQWQRQGARRQRRPTTHRPHAPKSPIGAATGCVYGWYGWPRSPRHGGSTARTRPT